MLSFPVSKSRVADYVPDVWGSLEPRYRDFGIEVPSLTVEQFWTQVTDFGIDEVDLNKLDCEGAEYLIISALSAPRGDECGTSDLDRAIKTQGDIASRQINSQHQN